MKTMARTDGSDVQNKLAKGGNQQLTPTQYFYQDTTKKYVEMLLKDRAGQFLSSMVSMTNLVPGLAKCEPKTILYCGLKAAALNLPLDNSLGFAYAVPYGGKAQFQIGYKGLIQLAQRTGQLKRVNVIEVRQGELKSWNPFTEEIEIEISDDARDKLPVIGYAAMFELINGFQKTSYWSKEKVTNHAKRFSKTFSNGPWKTDFDAMAKKTVLKDLLSKWGPLSTEIQEAVKYDQAVITKDEHGNEQPEYVDADFSVVDEPEEPSMQGEAEPQQQEIG
jgi:recombination protein RecT